MILEDDVLFTCTKEYLHDTIKNVFGTEYMGCRFDELLTVMCCACRFAGD